MLPKKLLLGLNFLFIVSLPLFSQDKKGNDSPQRNLAYVEIGGASLFTSVNYERQLTKEPRLSLRTGLGFYSESELYLTYNSGLHFLFAFNEKKDSFIDLGLVASLAMEYFGIRADRS